MRTAAVRALRNHYTRLLKWIGSGEETIITQKGKAIARLSFDANQKALALAEGLVVPV